MTDTAARDVERARAALADGCLLHPCEGEANTVDLAQAMASLAGAPVDVSPNAQRVADVIGQHDHYVFVLVDGLGMNLIERLPRNTFFAAQLVTELRAVFPSSTAPALTSIATARWPAEHSVTGWWTHLPDAGLTATILPYIERFSENRLDHTKVPPSYAFPAPALAGDFTHDFMTYSPREIAGSTYSRYSTSDAPFAGYHRLSRAIEHIRDRIMLATRPTYTYLYVPFVDTAEHNFGHQSRETARVLDNVQTRIELLAEQVAGRARIVVTADHGQLTVEQRHVLTRSDPLSRMLAAPPSGDGRSPLFHVAEGCIDTFVAAFRQRFGTQFALLSVDDASAMRLFGPPPLTSETRKRLGDFIAIAMSRDVMLYEPGDELATMPGHHGGLTPDEMRIPLIVA